MSEAQDSLRAILERLRALETRIEQIEEKKSLPSQQPVQPALARVIKTLRDIGKASSAEDVAEYAQLSRNRASAYLNELASLGYVDKKPNLAKTSARYLFQYNPSKIPRSLRKQIEEE